MACFKDAADLHAELEEYPQAIERYERVADHSLGSNLTKYSVKDYWLRSLLCCLAMGVGAPLLVFFHFDDTMPRIPSLPSATSNDMLLSTLLSRQRERPNLPMRWLRLLTVETQRPSLVQW
jgi:hypothetical protein